MADSLEIESPEKCRKCKTEIIDRKIPFGKNGSILMATCECQAMRIHLKYQNSEFKEDITSL